MPFDIRLDRLHLTIQAALGWTNSHLYEIRAGDVGWGCPIRTWPETARSMRARRVSTDVLEDVGTKTLRYLYDFGDGWEHTIKIERMRTRRRTSLYPRLIEAAVAALPKMSAAPGATPSSSTRSPIPSTSATPNWPNGSAPGSFDPNDVDLAALKREVQTLAKRWARKTAIKRKQRN